MLCQIELDSKECKGKLYGKLIKKYILITLIRYIFPDGMLLLFKCIKGKYRI